MTAQADSPGGDDPVLMPFEAVYRLEHGDWRVGTRSLNLSRDENNTFLLESNATSQGLAALFVDNIIERGSYRIIDTLVTPISYSYEQVGGKKRRVRIDFDWANGRATNTIGDEPWQMKIPPGTQDKLGLFLSLMADLQKGKRDITYPIADGGKLKSYRFNAVKEEILETTLGRLQTVKLKRIRKKKTRETYIWCARELNYLMVRMEQYKDGEHVITMAIDSINGLLPDTTSASQ
jgi:hypothetical protein